MMIAMDKKYRLLIFLFFLMFLSVPARAMSVEHIDDYQTYKPVGWNVYTGVQMDGSTAGFSIDLPLMGKNASTFDLNSPDGTTVQWWVWVRVINTSSDTLSNIDPHPPDMDFRLTCGSSGGLFHITSNATNSTWNSGYTLFRLTINTESMIMIAEKEVSPTGRELWSLQRDCYVEVFPDFLPVGEFVKISFWNVNPSREVICSIDPAVSYLQETTIGLISINYQIWQILFDLFSIVMILLAVFGLPILLFKLVRWIIDELKRGVGGRKVF
jgi:hypothetical protein